MAYSVENWSNYFAQGDVMVTHSQYALVDLNKPVKTMDGDVEYEMLCICPTEEKAVELVHLLNGSTR